MNEPAKQVRDFFEKRNDPLEKERARLRENRKKREEDNFNDKGL